MHLSGNKQFSFLTDDTLKDSFMDSWEWLDSYSVMEWYYILVCLPIATLVWMLCSRVGHLIFIRPTFLLLEVIRLCWIIMPSLVMMWGDQQLPPCFSYYSSYPAPAWVCACGSVFVSFAFVVWIMIPFVLSCWGSGFTFSSWGSLSSVSLVLLLYDPWSFRVGYQSPWLFFLVLWAKVVGSQDVVVVVDSAVIQLVILAVTMVVVVSRMFTCKVFKFIKHQSVLLSCPRFQSG